MIRHVVITVVFVLLKVSLSHGCQPRINAAAVAVITTTPAPTTTPTSTPTTTPTTTTTTTTSAPCISDSNTVVLSVEKDTVFVEHIFGTINATSTCAECDTGSDRYYKPTTTAIPRHATTVEAIGSLLSTDCPNLCICDLNNECYKSTSFTVNVTFWPYCSSTGTECGVYVVIDTSNSGEGLLSTTTSKMYVYDDQINETHTNFKGVTDAAYFQAKTVGCTSCVTTTCTGRA